jgi:peptidoglycan/LPS O-acetylase OafA/YrhL
LRPLHRQEDDVTSTAHDAYLARRYFPELDGLRALCVLLVVTVHMYDADRWWRWLAGERGVTVFFVLSGFLITTLGLREERGRGAVSLAAFYVRRCCRLLPLYYLTLAAYVVLIFGFNSALALRSTLAEALPYYLGYLQEVPFYSWLVVGQRDVPFFHSWSLGVEEKFYLVWPFLVFVLWSRRRRRLASTAGLWMLFAAAPFVMAREHRIVGRALFAYSHLLAGCLLALLLDGRKGYERLAFLGRPRGTILATVVFLAVHLATPSFPEPAASGYLWHLLYAAATVMLLSAVLTGDGSLSRVLRVAPLVFVGRLSYGVYLVHVLAIIAVNRVLPVYPSPLVHGMAAYALTCAVAVGLAWLMSVLVEKKGIELGRRWSSRLLERAAVTAPVTLRARPRET